MTPENIINALPKGLWSSALAAASALRVAQRILIASHIDADGICAAAIASTSVLRLGKRPTSEFFKKLDSEAIEALRGAGADVIWFTDLGSGSCSRIEGMRAVITDHHAVDPSSRVNKRNDGQATLSDFSAPIHVNPQLFGISGATELSGAGSTFLAAVALDSRNLDLAHLAVLGAIGDLQDQKSRRLEGLNRVISEAAQSTGKVEVLEDLRYFGRETRPIHKMLEFSGDPFLPRISGNEEGALSFLLELGIELKEGGSWRTWAELTDSEKRTLISALKEHLSSMRRKQETIDRLMGEVYVFTEETRGLPVRDAKEFSTLLNACGRHGKARVGLAICMGDRQEALSEGMALLRDHRSAISKALSWAKGSGIIRMKNIQFFDAGDEIEDTIVGTVAGMLLGSEGSDRSAPMVAFAESTEFSDSPKTKASARGTQELVSKGMDLSYAMRTAAEKVGGVGGGHNIAAGATIPEDRRDEFLDILDGLVGSQISGQARKRV